MTTADEVRSLLESAGLKLLYPDTDEYKSRNTSYWSVSAHLSPYCIVQPRSAEEVALIVTTLTQKTDCNFAVRSGGHSVWPGINNIDNGVTIDLGLMNKTTYDAEKKIASIGPGSLWEDVYGSLLEHGVTVAGGRHAKVGVAGFLTGGGNSFYTARHGFGCDNVVNWEVVTGKGEIINANASENPDLWQCLKGGQANFGIVTRIDMHSIEAKEIWGGVKAYPATKEIGDQHIAAYVDWTNNLEKYQDGSNIIIWTYMPQFNGIAMLVALEDTTGTEAAPAFSKTLAVEGSLSSTLRKDSHLGLVKELDLKMVYRNVWFALTVKNDIRMYHRVVELHEQMVNFLKGQSPDGDFVTQLLFQAVPTHFAQHSVAKGGNVMGMEREEGHMVQVLCTLAVHGEDQERIGRERMTAFREAVRQYSEECGAAADWIYLNYADYLQDPLKSYGPKNVAKMKAAAQKYDPEGIFQTRMPGGFKISKVSS